MKILLFTHISDIDGLNNVILSKLAFNDVDYILSEAFEIDNKVKENEYRFDDYDYIFVTDLCPSIEILNYLGKYKHKIKVFDHHKDALKDNHFDFVIHRVSDENGMCCGTSLFYEYLINNSFLKPNNTLDKFVELTRRYDTWEWKKYNDLESCNLMYLFNAIGIDEYLERISERIKESEFKLNNEDMFIVNKWKKEFDERIKEIVSKIIYTNILGYKAGIVEATHEYRNDIIEYIRNNNYDVDLIAIVLSDRNAISYRNVKDIDVSQIARHYGGNGHRAASSSPITEEDKLDIINYFNK